jgi:hypothetical protein
MFLHFFDLNVRREICRYGSHAATAKVVFSESIVCYCSVIATALLPRLQVIKELLMLVKILGLKQALGSTAERSLLSHCLQRSGSEWMIECK